MGGRTAILALAGMAHGWTQTGHGFSFFDAKICVQSVKPVFYIFKARIAGLRTAILALACKRLIFNHILFFKIRLPLLRAYLVKRKALPIPHQIVTL